MRTQHLSTALIVVFAATLVVGAQKSQPPKKEAAPKPITLNGCIGRGDSAPNQYTLSDENGMATYRLTGVDVRTYFGRRVQIVGGVPEQRKLTIVGGLVPSANAAAQAGAIDPARAATAAAGGSAGPGNVQLPEFKVKSVRPVSGSCPG